MIAEGEGRPGPSVEATGRRALPAGSRLFGRRAKLIR